MGESREPRGEAHLKKNLSSLIMPMSNWGSLAAMQHSSCDGHGTDACT
jgi:hypothetical protein